MKEIKLDVQLRNQLGTRKVKKIRRENFIPGIVYGGEEKKPTPVRVERGLFEHTMRTHRGQSVIFHLNILDGDKKLRDYSAIVREEQHDPTSDRLIHLDFQRISLKEEIEVKIPIHVTGDPVGVKKDGGSLDQMLWELDIVCLPMDIPEKVEINVETLKIGDALHVKDLVLPQGVKTKHDLEAIVVAVAAPMKEEVAVPAEGQPTEPEVMMEKPKEKTEEKTEEKGKAEDKGEKKSAEKKPEGK